MRDIQEIFDQAQGIKEEQKEIKAEYKDALTNADDYEEIVEKIKVLKEKKKQIEAVTQSKLGSRYTKFEENKSKLKELQEMLTDIAMTTLMNGKTVAVKDKNETSYEPVYKVSFKKID